MVDPVIDDSDFKLYIGDVLDVLKQMPDESVNCCVTSPPYWNQRDYGTAEWIGGDAECDHLRPVGGEGKSTLTGSAKSQRASQERQRIPYLQVCGRCGAERVDQQIGLEKTPDEYVTKMVEVFREVRRVLKDDGTLWLNIGDSYAANRSYQVPDSKHTEVGNSMAAIVPAGLKPKDLVGIPWMLAFALRADGWFLRSEIVWSKPNAMPESIRDRPTCAHEKVFLLSKNSRYFYDKESVREEAEWKRWGDQTNVKYNDSRSSKAGFIKNRSKKSIYEYLNTPGDQQGMTKNLRNVWEIMTHPYAEAHFATFPEDLVEPCIKAGCPEQVCGTCGETQQKVIETDNKWKHDFQDTRGTPEGKTGNPQSSESLHCNGGGVYSSARVVGVTDCGHNDYHPGIVLDPFMGSGTTALVARRLGRRSVGIELNQQYVGLISKRTQQLSLIA